MNPLLCSALLLAFVFAMTKIISEHAQKRHTKFEGRYREDDNKANQFCEHCNGLPLYFYHQILSDLRFCLSRFTVHTNTKAHIFGCESQSNI